MDSPFYPPIGLPPPPAMPMYPMVPVPPMVPGLPMGGPLFPYPGEYIILLLNLTLIALPGTRSVSRFSRMEYIEVLITIIPTFQTISRYKLRTPSNVECKKTLKQGLIIPAGLFS